MSNPGRATSSSRAVPAPNTGMASSTRRGEIPHFVQFTSPVSTSLPGELRSATTLPLNLVALITSYLDDIADIARVTRTCRLLYYMTLPQLYTKVVLHSYADLRLINGRPEGFGSGSPFMMALDGLVTKNHGSLVQELRLWGEWKEANVNQFTKGRIPDNTMMLNILLRAATDKMAKLRTVTWDLDCKPLKTVYQGLSMHDTLTTLTLRFPASRIPRPSVLIPPMANLRAFKALDIDPMCYPDDMSLLICNSKKLEDLRMHFSPRMRREAECTTNLDAYFGRCVQANYRLRLRHFALQNLYSPNPALSANGSLFETGSCESVCFMNTFGSVGGDPRTVFVDDTWKNLKFDNMTQARICRTNDVNTQHVEIMSRGKNEVERLYMVGAQRPSCDHVTHGPEIGTPNSQGQDTDITALKDRYVHVLTRMHGDSLRHLLLSDSFALSIQDVRDLIRYCPNVEQLGFAMDTSDHDTVRLVLPFLPRLHVLRVLRNEFLDEHMRNRSHEERMRLLGEDLGHSPTSNLRWLGLGETIYHAGDLVEVPAPNGGLMVRRNVTMVGPETVKDIELWSLDVVDINLDPVMPFR